MEKITGEDMVDQVHGLKATAIVVFKRAAFELHRWNSNVPELEADKQLTDDSQTCQATVGGLKPPKQNYFGSLRRRTLCL